MPSPVDGADRVQRVELAERGGLLHLRRDVPGLQAVDLVDDDDHRHPEREHPARDEPVPRSDPVACAHDDHDDVDITGDRLVDPSLHPLGQRVDRLLPARQVDQHELRVIRRIDAADLVAGRVRLVGDDRDLRARQRIDERRLAHVRPAGDGHEARLHGSPLPAPAEPAPPLSAGSVEPTPVGSSHVSGSSSAAVAVPIEPSARR